MTNAKGPEKQVRLDTETRRRQMLDLARSVFAEKGYSQSGLAEIASRAGVSKTLVYHYFPEGRAELYREVMGALGDELVEAALRAMRAPVGLDLRVRALVEAVLDFFVAEPDAFRLLILEPWGSGDQAILVQAMALRVRIGTELAMLLGSSGAPFNQTAGVATAAVGSLVYLCEAMMSGQLTRAEAAEVGSRFLCFGLHGLETPSGS